MEWLRRHPLAAFLPLQALLYSWNLTLFSPWGDEVGNLLVAHGSLREAVQFAAQDIHPPLYYSLLYYWQRIPLGMAWEAQGRLLSVCFALLGTVALDRLWGRRFEERTRVILLALWTLSPCLLLYARMCRSYTLQALCTIVAGALLLQVMEKPARRNAALLAIALLATMYTHYLAGIALIATANLSLCYRRKWRTTIAVDCAVAVGYLPWIWHFATSLASWGNNARNYSLTGSRALEVPLKFAYWSLSFVMGEAVPDAGLVLGALLLPLVVALAWRGARRTPELAWVAATLGAIGFVGVARWVSYPFVPARMILVLPFFLLLVARGAGDRSRWGNLAVAGMLLLSLSGIWCYFHKNSFRNKQYPLPMEEIAARILRESRAEDSAILVDSTNSDPIALLYAFFPQRPFVPTPRRSLLPTGAPGTAATLARLLDDPQVRTVWFLRNTHDVSPTGLNTQFETQLRGRMAETVHRYEAYTPLERMVLGTGAPRYFHELLEFRR